jgi:hypothetical protein
MLSETAFRRPDTIRRRQNFAQRQRERGYWGHLQQRNHAAVEVRVVQGYLSLQAHITRCRLNRDMSSEALNGVDLLRRTNSATVAPCTMLTVRRVGLGRPQHTRCTELNQGSV